MTAAVAVLAGVMFGAGVIATVWGIRPPLTPLDQRVAVVLSSTGETTVTARSRWRDTIAARTPRAVLPDLALLGRTPHDFLTARLIWAAATAATTVLVAGLAGAPPLLLPAAATAGGAGGWYLAVYDLQESATRRRRTLGLALAAWTQMAAMMIRAGVGVEQALRHSAAAGNHWTFQLLSTALDRAVDHRQPLWHTLAQLGADTDVAEIRQLAAELRLTDTAGGTPADTLLAHAQTIRDQDLADQLAAAKTAEVKTAYPLVLLFMTLVGFIIYPTIRTFLGT